MRWIVVGAGSAGQRHAHNLLSLHEEVVLLRRVDQQLTGSLATIPVYTDLETARGSVPAAIAIICTPTASHIRDALAAARADCHVLVEKPLARDLTGVEELREEVERRGVRCGVAYCLRFHPVLRQVRQILADGAIGRPLIASAWAGQYLPDWRRGLDYRQSYSARSERGGGVVLDLSHEIDYLLWFFGHVEQVNGVTDRTGSLDIESEDNADMLLRFASGVRASCHLDYVAQPPRRGGRVAGSTGTVEWDLLSGTAGLWTANGGWRTHSAPTGWNWNDMYVDELRAFRAAVDGGAWDSDIGSASEVLAICTRLKAESR